MGSQGDDLVKGKHQRAWCSQTADHLPRAGHGAHGRPGGVPIYFQAQLRLHFSRKTRARKESPPPGGRAENCTISGGGAAETRACPASPPCCRGPTTHLPLYLQAQPVRDLPDLVDIGEHLIICSDTQTRRQDAPGGPAPFPALAGRTLPGRSRPGARPRRRPSPPLGRSPAAARPETAAAPASPAPTRAPTP